MNVVVTCSHHFDRTPDGRVWTNGTCPYLFWTRYLGVFTSVRVVTRVREVPEVPSDEEPADGPGVTFFPIRDYLGPQQFLCRAPGILARAEKSRSQRRRFNLPSAKPFWATRWCRGCVERSALMASRLWLIPTTFSRRMRSSIRFDLSFDGGSHDVCAGSARERVPQPMSPRVHCRMRRYLTLPSRAFTTHFSRSSSPAQHS